MADGEAWYSFPAYCRNTFGRKLYRVALDAGMTCPNRDGRIATGGCIFCDEGGSGDFAIPYTGRKLHEDELIYNSSHTGNGSYIAYFQAYTNTYAPVERLRMLYTAALEDPLFAGVSIATRPDCLGPQVMSLLRELKRSYPDKFIWIELGLQTRHDPTAMWIRRGYTLDVFYKACCDLCEAGIPFIVHMILGLPFETEDMVLDTVRCINDVQAFGIKIQLLQYLKGTALGKMYEEHVVGMEAMTEEAYVTLVTKCLGMLDPKIVVHRLTGDADKELMIAPKWALHKRKVINEIRHRMAKDGIVQGSLK